MAHVILDPSKPKGAVKTRPEWLDAARQVGEYVNLVAERRDLIAYVGEGLGGTAPACYTPATAEIEVNTDICLAGAAPESVNLASRSFCLRRSPFVGAVTHEAAHARFSVWVPSDLVEAFPTLTKRLVDVFMLLEESRIEHQILLTDETRRPYLRACAGDIVARDFHIADDAYGAAAGAGLLLARVDAGVFVPDDVADARKAILGVLDDDTLATLTKLWVEFQKLRFVQDASCPATNRALAICQEWLDALGVSSSDESDNLAGGSGEGEGGETEEGSGDLSDIVKSIAREIGTNADADNTVEAKSADAEQAIQDAKDEAERKERAEEAAHRMFGTHGYSPTRNSQYCVVRKPKPAEHAAAVTLARELEQAQFRARHVVKTSSVLPPGRIKGRGALQRTIQVAQGGIVKAEPWHAKKRRHADDAPLSVGILTDVSGSMGMGQEPSGVLSWVTSEAVRRVQGKVASALFGDDAYGVVRSGERQSQVKIFTADGGWERFSKAFDAVDGDLGLLSGDGARVLVIFSDGHFVRSAEANYANKVMALCESRGVSVVWVKIVEGHLITHGHGDVVDVLDLPPAAAARKIGRAIVESVRKANLRAQALG
jgi:hypothetical protein